MTDPRREPHPANTLNELPGRGVAVLHEVAPDDGLPVRARARGAEGAWREQATAAHGPADRVLHAGPASSSSTRSRASAERCSGRPSRAVRGGRSASSSIRAGSPSTTRSCRSRRGARRLGPTLADLGHGRPGRRRGRSTRPGSRCGSGDALALLPTLEDGIGRLRRDRSALQPAAAADDGRRRTGRDARQPPDRLRDDQRRTGRPGQRRRTIRRSSTDGGGVRRARAASCATVAMPSSSSATRTRTGATCSPGPDLAGRARGSRSRAEGRPHLVPGRDAATTVRLSAGLRAEHRPPAHPGAARGRPGRLRRGGGLEVGGEHVAVDVIAHRPGVGGDRHRGRRGALDGGRPR